MLCCASVLFEPGRKRVAHVMQSVNYFFKKGQYFGAPFTERFQSSPTLTGWLLRRVWLLSAHSPRCTLCLQLSASYWALASQEAAYEDAFTEACFQTYMVTLRVKAEMVDDEHRVKNTIQRMTPVDFKTESQALLDAIAKYN